MDPNNAIEFDRVSKSFQTGVFKGNTFMQDLRITVQRIAGRVTPASILSRQDISSESSKKNQRFWAVRDVSFSVGNGEVVAVLGKNGAGKSTLLQMLCRITQADSGLIRVRGKIASLLGAGVGFNEEMTGRENVFLNGSILGMTPDQIEESMDSIVEFAEIPQFLDTPIKRYSNGMKSRLGFSIAVHLECDIMVLDEVFAAGDKVFREKCIEKMKELALSGRTILIVIHFPEMLREVCHRGVVMKDGSIIYDGEIERAIEVYLGKMDC